MEKTKDKAKLVADSILYTLQSGQKVVVLTGAGISTESGIPDFRSPQGIWSRFDPGLFCSEVLYSDPERFYRSSLKLLDFLSSIKNAVPNKAHIILAQMQKRDFISSIITQNIDGLHKKAGSKKVYEVHGNLEGAYCTGCGFRTSFDILIEKLSKKELPPKCEKCSGVLRPSIILFGDMLPDDFLEAEREVKNCGLLIIVGSSLEVAPVNSLPYLSKKFVIINEEATYFDSMAQVCMHKKATAALEQIYDYLTDK